jgi:protein TonB
VVGNVSVLAAFALMGCVAAFAPVVPAVQTTPRTATADDYPEESVRLHEEGVTRLRYLIGADGTVGAVEILESSGHPRLDAASAAMVIERWRFEPATRNGEAVETWDDARIVWRLAPRGN